MSASSGAQPLQLSRFGMPSPAAAIYAFPNAERVLVLLQLTKKARIGLYLGPHGLASAQAALERPSVGSHEVGADHGA
eukprot:scaffold768_cov382-Prasinococcus_capsulatus_cf.AAC.6